MKNSKTSDPIFDDPRLASIYDALESDRSDLVPYVNLANEYEVHNVVDLGCGTGVLALMLAEQKMNVIAIDPAQSSLVVAQSKPGAEHVQWIHGDSTIITHDNTDMVIMTGNTAQAITDDKDWATTLDNVRKSLRADGLFVFETRNPDFEGWKEWNKEASYRKVDIPTTGTVETWVDLLDVALPYVSFRWTWIFLKDNTTLASDSKIRFRSQNEVENDLVECGFQVIAIREAPDRIGKELVFIAKRVH
jgi:ubiquinone/menaquinone biosynthesis C-methylase UbiE